MRWASASVSEILTVSECRLVFTIIELCSFPSYLVLASIQKLPEGMAIITVLFPWCEVPERKCRDRNVHATMYYATTLKW